MNVDIREIKAIDSYLEDLITLMLDTVHAGASIGFHAPMHRSEAETFWESHQPNELRIMLGAFYENQLIGSVYVELEQKPNGSHRGEICKLMVHPNARRLGVARALMQEIEQKAIEQKRSLLILDTREGDAANRLYRSLGYQFAGAIPNFARNEEGLLETTNLYYKTLANRD